MPRRPKLTPDILEAALVGLQTKRQRIADQIAQVQRLLGARGTERPRATAAPTTSDTAQAPARRKPRMSAAGRERIAEAQRKRWAAKRATEAAEQKRLAEIKERRIAAMEKARKALAKKRKALAKKRKATKRSAAKAPAAVAGE